jgi:indole-3-glycerol phosphate synthase
VLLPAGAFVDEDDLGTLQQLGTIVSTAHSLGMDAILSVRSSEDLALALDVDPDAIVIDNRDDDGRIDVERTFDLLNEVPVGNPVISESVGDADEVAKLHRAGVDALLLDEGHVDVDLPNALAVFRDLTLD